MSGWWPGFLKTACSTVKTDRDAAPAAAHPGETLGRPARLLTSRTLGVGWKITLPGTTAG